MHATSIAFDPCNSQTVSQLVSLPTPPTSEFALPNGMVLDVCHCMLHTLPVMIQPRVDGDHCPVEYLSRYQAESGDHTEAPNQQKISQIDRNCEYVRVVDPVANPESPRTLWMILVRLIVNYIVRDCAFVWPRPECNVDEDNVSNAQNGDDTDQ